jgi:hypothetical protein
MKYIWACTGFTKKKRKKMKSWDSRLSKWIKKCTKIQLNYNNLDKNSSKFNQITKDKCPINQRHSQISLKIRYLDILKHSNDKFILLKSNFFLKCLSYHVIGFVLCMWIKFISNYFKNFQVVSSIWQTLWRRRKKW